MTYINNNFIIIDKVHGTKLLPNSETWTPCIIDESPYINLSCGPIPCKYTATFTFTSESENIDKNLIIFQTYEFGSLVDVLFIAKVNLYTYTIKNIPCATSFYIKRTNTTVGETLENITLELMTKC